MSDAILGIHHVTAIATEPQTNLDFYAGVLGLRLVKRTVNFDDPGTYHLYYGDETGRPGTLLTFFAWPGARRGSRGAGQATTVALSVPEGSIGFWQKRLASAHVVMQDPEGRFDEEGLVFLDPDGLLLELVAHPGAGLLEPWAGGPVPERHAVRGVRAVTLSVQGYEATADLLTAGMGLEPAGELRNRFRFRAPEGGGVGTLVDLLCTPDLPRGRIAAGTVHHVAWRVEAEPQQLAWRGRLAGRGLDVTPVLDRKYFRSIYFREPGGVLFEIATDTPGFTADETPAELGSSLELPEWLEPQRARLERELPPLGPPAEVGEEPR